MHVARRRTTTVAVAAALLTAAAVAVVVAPSVCGQANPAAAPAPAVATTGGRVAVVNLVVLRDTLREFTDLKTRHQAQIAIIQAIQNGHKAQLESMQDKIRNLKPDSDQFNAALVDFDEKRAQYQVDEQLKQAALFREENLKKKHVFVDELQAVVADLAKRKGIDLVTIYNEVQFPPTVMNMDPQQLDQLIAQRQTLYVSDKIDLTAEVATAMDARYKAQGNGGGGGGGK